MRGQYAFPLRLNASLCPCPLPVRQVLYHLHGPRGPRGVANSGPGSLHRRLLLVHRLGSVGGVRSGGGRIVPCILVGVLRSSKVGGRGGFRGPEPRRQQRWRWQKQQQQRRCWRLPGSEDEPVRGGGARRADTGGRVPCQDRARPRDGALHHIFRTWGGSCQHPSTVNADVALGTALVLSFLLFLFLHYVMFWEPSSITIVSHPTKQLCVQS